MGRLTLAERIYLDSNVFIAALEGAPEHAVKARAFFAAFKTRPMRTVTSELVVAEVMGKESARVGWAEQSRFFLDLVVWGGFIGLRPVSRDILWDTGDLRRQTRQAGRSLGLPDAIHIATAVATRCGYVLSADQRLYSPSTMRRLDPFTVEVPQIERLLDA